MNPDPQQARSIFLAAVERPAEERPAYLHEACGGDAGLRHRVEVLLGAHEQANSLLDRPAAALAATTDQPAREAPGTVLGPYKLIEEIGEGGMGTVYLAQQTAPVKRLVALKVIKPGMDSKQVLARFEAERQALALMDHPNIARVLDAGATAAGRPYFVMELVKGAPLTQYCDEHRLTPRQRLGLFIPVCQAIQHAHQKGIIHRDIKPSNVLVALYDGNPVPKVIDFGIAKATGQQLTERTLVTGFGTVVGTLEYMSPEQAELDQLDIDTRSDIYSLGVLLYELLTGTTPLDRKRLKAAALLEVLRIIREEEPPRPSMRLNMADELPAVAANRGLEPRKLSGLVRGELDWMVMKALEKDRNRRYETANGFAHDVQRYLADEPVLACPPSAWYRVRKFARRNRGRLVVAAGLFLAVTVMAASIGWAVGDRLARAAEIERAETARLATVQGQVRDSFNAARTLLAENQLAAARQKLAEAKAQLGNDGGALADLAAAVEAGAAELNRYRRFLDLIDRAHEAETSPLLEAASSAGGSPGRGDPKTLPPARGWDRRPAAAVPFLLGALARYEVLERDDWNTLLAGGILGKDQVEHVRRTAYEELLWLADDVVRRRQEHRSGQTLSPKAAARAALAYLGKAENARSPTLAFYVLRARCRKALGEEAAAQADRQRATKMPPTMALDHYLRGQEAFDAKKFAVAIRAFESALRLEPTHYWSMMQLGSCLYHGQAAEDCVGALRIFSGCLLKRPDHAHAYYHRGNAYYFLRRKEEAVADYSKAIDLDPKHTGAWVNRGVNYMDLGQPAKAVADCSRAIELEPLEAGAWFNRGAAYLDLAEPARAAADLSKAIALKQDYWDAWYNRGIAHERLGQPDKGIADYSRAIAIDGRRALAWLNRSRAYLSLGQNDKAVADSSRAIELDRGLAAAWGNRGIAYVNLRQHDKALADLSRAIDLNPKLWQPWYTRGVLYSDLAQLERAIADLSRAIELNEKVMEVWFKRGTAFGRLGQADKAVADFSRAIDLEPGSAGPWHNRGTAYLHLGQLDKAIADCSRAVELKPDFVDAWHNRGLAYVYRGEPDRALADFSRAIKLNPKYVSAWFNRGKLYGDLGQWARAVADCSTFIELAPNAPQVVEAYLRRAQGNSRLARFAAARADYQAALKRAPANAGAHNALAWLLANCPEVKLRDPGQAVESARRAVQLAPEAGDYRRTLGVAHYRAGDWKAAVAALNESLERRKGGDAVAWLFLAMTHRKLGNEEARKAYDQALRWLEGNREALEKDKAQAEELRRFRGEAEAVLELKKK